MRHKRLQACIDRHPALEACAQDISRAFELLCATFEEGGKLLICGNGGSAADADHIAGELLKGFDSARPLNPDWKGKLGDELGSCLQTGLPVIPLTGFNALNTAFANDCNGEYTFAQLTFALGQTGDALLAISTSGDSSNVLHAARTARAMDMPVIGLTGESGGQLLELTDACIRVPASIVWEVQELHLPTYHALCLMLEDHFFREA
jgi:D-sedoheptulose 7-phosphate isomerase